MAAQKRFFQDRTALLLVSGVAFLVFVLVVSVLLQLGNGRNTTNFIISYRPSLGIDQYTTGTLKDALSFIVAALLFGVVGVVLSYRTYSVRRELSLMVLSIAVVLLLFLAVVSNQLLVLR